MLLEVIATSLDDVQSAVRAGADRIELVTGLLEGGMTPSIGLMEEAVRLSAVPVHVMIRPHNQSFHYDRHDIKVMLKDIEVAKRAGAAGIVVGALTSDARVDKQALNILLEGTEGLAVTFHRAFDDTRNMDEALDDLLVFRQVNRILTSGGRPSVLDAEETIKRLVRRTKGTAIHLLAGSGLTVETLSGFIQETGVREVHFGRGVRIGNRTEGRIDENRIMTIKQLQRNLSRD
ncbi:copper homeostasis protein CutC [Paenibacillus beijingensis]|uniref:PF03932 family protein CutC n=1 Tax=Paenibacillus beijingensis TaxID=1126833 RepID=A0A0D5NEQ4_9BACL|nr:copper homeostasis protein CutC [Paenibacillus beijingensis]AJY73462.1 copper homeostasis protein [Paenibacillus beijingensis]